MTPYNLFLLCFVVFICVTIGRAALLCKEIKGCFCESFTTEVNIRCAQGNKTDLMVNYKKGSKPLLEIDCGEFSSTQINSSIFDILSELNVGPVYEVSFNYCPLPANSFKSFMTMLNITELEYLTFAYSNNFIGELSPPFLDDLPNLRKLSIAVNTSLTGIHQNLLKETPNLTALFLRGNIIEELHPDVFQHVPKLKTLDLGFNKISNLDPKTFRNLSSLRLLNIDNNALRTVTDSLFNNVPNLMSLDISGNNMFSLPPGVFESLTKLTHFQANKNSFKFLPTDLFSRNKNLQTIKIINFEDEFEGFAAYSFANLPYLTNVSIRGSNMQTIPENLFWNSTGLKAISLTGHKLLSLPKKLFRDSKLLVKLELTQNELKTLPDNVFVHLYDLNELHLGQNKLTNITDHTFAGLVNLEFLDLSQNLLKNIGTLAFDMLRELKTIDLSQNFLQLNDNDDSPFKACSKLEKLILANNSIHKIYNDWISGSMESLELLDLTKNNFTFLPNIFNTMSTNVEIDLSLNNISVIDLNQFETKFRNMLQDALPANEVHVILQGNPISCDCRNYELIRYFSYSMVNEVTDFLKLKKDKLVCNETGEAIAKMTPDRISCPLENCPAHCTCKFWPYNSFIDVNCTSSELRELPPSLPTEYNNKQIDSIHLTLKNNLIEHLPDNVSEEYNRVTQLDLSNNSLTHIKAYSYFSKLQKLDLSKNSLSSIDKDFLTFISKSKQLLNNSLALYDNPWACDCNVPTLHYFVLEHHALLYKAENITCQGSNTSLTELKYEDYCDQSRLALSLAFLGFLLGFTIAFYYRFKFDLKAWMYAHPPFDYFVKVGDIDIEKTYDAFVSYASGDDEFVLKTLIPGLEKNFKITHHLRDFVPGEQIHSQIIKSVNDSRRTIIVLSQNFLRSYWGNVEFHVAYAQAIRENRARVIILIHGDVPSTNELDNDLREYMSLNTYVQWGDPLFWEKINYVLPHPPARPSTKIFLVDPLISKKKNSIV